jgi:hypothetical protein
MAALRRTLKSVRWMISFGAALLCMAALLWPRGAAPALRFSFSNTLDFHSTAHHDQGRCFDSEDSQWVAALGTPLVVPPQVTSSEAIYNLDVFVEFVTDGWHYNRPPPIG